MPAASSAATPVYFASAEESDTDAGEGPPSTRYAAPAWLAPSELRGAPMSTSGGPRPSPSPPPRTREPAARRPAGAGGAAGSARAGPPPPAPPAPATEKPARSLAAPVYSMARDSDA